MDIPLTDAILRIFLAFILGSVIGVEREMSNQSAGLRTHILVCLGSAVFSIISISTMLPMLPHETGDVTEVIRIVRDPARIAAQVVTGIGFIGGGAVLRHGATVKGLTTAASLWMMASIGMLCGMGFYYLSIIATLFSFVALFTVGSIEHRVFNKSKKQYTRMRVRVTCDTTKEIAIQEWLDNHHGNKVVEVKHIRDEKLNTSTLTYFMDIKGQVRDLSNISKRLNTVEGVKSSDVRIYNEEYSG